MTASTVRLIPATPSSTVRTSPRPMLLVSAAASIRVPRPSRREISRPSRDASVMTPNPPVWMSARIVTCPNGDQ